MNRATNQRDWLLLRLRLRRPTSPLLLIAACSIILSAGVSGQHKTDALFPVIVKGKRGYIDSTGRIVIKPRFGYASGFSDGIALVKINKDDALTDEPQGIQFGYIDYSGSIVISEDVGAAGDFSEGFAKMKTNPFGIFRDSKWGYINSSGAIAIETKYDDAGDFSNGFAWV